MKNIKNMKIGRGLGRIPIARPENYVYERPERIRLPFPERLVNAILYFRPDLQVRTKGNGICFYQYKIKLLPNEARYGNSVHPFETTRQFLEDLTDNGIVNLSKSDICYISKFIDKN